MSQGLTRTGYEYTYKGGKLSYFRASYVKDGEPVAKIEVKGIFKMVTVFNPSLSKEIGKKESLVYRTINRLRKIKYPGDISVKVAYTGNCMDRSVVPLY